MQLTYDNFALHDLGEIEVSQTHDFEGGENPYRARVSFKVTLGLFERNYADNYALILEAREKLKVQHGQLKWTDSDTQSVWVDQPATVVSVDLPEEWGEYEQRAVITFSFYQNLTTPSAPVTLTFGAASIVLDQMQEWRESYTAERFSNLHPERRTAQMRVACRGVSLGNPSQTPAQRRADLDARKADWMAKVKSLKECTLAYGAFSQVVKIESFEAGVDQAGTMMAVEFTVAYTAFPNEADFAIADITVSERMGDSFAATGNGEQFLSISAKIMAHTDAAATTKFNALRAAIVLSYGYQSGQLTDIMGEPASVMADLDGERFMEKSFRAEYRKWRADNLAATFQRNGDSTGAKSLGQVTGYSYRYSATRFDEMRSHRRHASATVTLKGVIPSGAPEATPAAQRAILDARHKAITTEVNGADGRLIYGTLLDAQVRVEEFTAEINQALQAIEWTLTASRTLFPNESGYATVEFTTATRESVEDGDRLFTFNGRILAQSEAAARAKLDLVRTSALAGSGFALKHQLRAESSASNISANGDKTQGLTEAADGTTFLELSFTEEYRKRMVDLLSWTLSISDSDETTRGFINTNYSGQVVASGATAAAAYAAALAKAVALGADKYPFLVRSVISYDQRQVQSTSDIEFVRLTFSYEYQRKGTKFYLEMSSSVSTDTFGNDREAVSGFISAADLATAQAKYASEVRTAFAARMILSEEFNDSKQRLENESQFVRLDFRLEVFRQKTGTGATLRYEIEISKDWLTLRQTSTVSGSCYAKDQATAMNAIAAFIGTLNLGQPREERTREARARSGQEPGAPDELFVVDFTQVFDKRIEGVSALLECEVNEEIEYSGTRWVVQDLPRNSVGAGGISLIQDTGVSIGRRNVRGTVTAGSQATGLAWADLQRTLLTGDADGGHYEMPPQITRGYVFAPRTDGIPTGSTENVQLHRIAFAFGELLPNYPYGEVVPGPEFSAAGAGDSGFKVKTLELENPTASDRVSIGILTSAIQVMLIRSFVLGVGTGVTWTLKFDSDPNGAGIAIASGITTLQSDGVKQTVDFLQSSIPAGSVLWLETSGVTGSPTELLINLEYE
jgi:hypothetical protein